MGVRSMPRCRAILAILACWISGCAPFDKSQPYENPERLDHGLVLVFTGIEGRSWINSDICQGLDKGGVDMAIRLVDWTTHIPGAYIYDQRAEARNRQKADQIAADILEYRAEHPGRPVILIGQSGGGAMAAWTAECLPDRYGVDGIIMMAVSLSPGYQLDGALGRSRRGIVSFYSEKDFLLLGAGVLAIGDLVNTGALAEDLPALSIGFVAAAISGYLCIRWLLGYLQRRSLTVFAVYCALFGLFCLAVALIRG